MAETQVIPITKIETNNGQIEGLPKNPRFIRDDKYQKLVKSIEDDPEMLDLRELIVIPVNGKFVTIAGNMRLRAMRELKMKEAPCKILPENTPVEKLKAYVIKDNVSFGEHSWDDLANEWDFAELENWGVDLPTEWSKENEDFSDKNTEVDVDDFGDEMIIKLKYTEKEYNKVRDQLSKVAATPEQAVWKLLGNE